MKKTKINNWKKIDNSFYFLNYTAPVKYLFLIKGVIYIYTYYTKVEPKTFNFRSVINGITVNIKEKNKLEEYLCEQDAKSYYTILYF